MANDYPTVPGTKIRDLTGEVFGGLTVVKYSHARRRHFLRANGHKDVHVQHFWECVCLCGRTKAMYHHDLLKGMTISCGCMRQQRLGTRRRTHGQSNTKMYYRWRGMLDRCYAHNNKHYADYGGRGITVCETWRTSFANFLADMGQPPFASAMLERIDNDGDYRPDNCRWATPTEQARNKRGTKLLTFQGKTQTLTEWCNELGLPYFTIARRLNSAGWSVERALSEPIHFQHKECP